MFEKSFSIALGQIGPRHTSITALVNGRPTGPRPPDRGGPHGPNKPRPPKY